MGLQAHVTSARWSNLPTPSTDKLRPPRWRLSNKTLAGFGPAFFQCLLQAAVIAREYAPGGIPTCRLKATLKALVEP
jgi:hypothetical protein